MKDQLLADLRPFTDFASEISTQINNNTKSVSYLFERNGKRELRLYNDGRIWSSLSDLYYNSFPSVLASPEFIDISRFLEIQRRAYPATKYLKNVVPSFHQGEKSLSYNEFMSISNPKATERPTVFLIDGAAGVGKTTIIEQMVSMRAHSEASQLPILHVASRGRKLGSLDDAISVSIHSLNIFTFGYAQVPALMRNGIIQVAVDGFDELSDPEGYRTAWHALARLVLEAGGASPIILAGRDTFFSAQKFRETLEKFDARPDITAVRLSPPPSSRAVEWLNSRGWELSPNSNEVKAFLDDGSVLLRPFFLSTIADARSFDGLYESAGNVWKFIADIFIEREARILEKAIPVPVQSINKCLNILFSLVAEDMAERERNSIATDVLSFLAEVAFDGVVDMDQLRGFLQRVESIALMDPTSNSPDDDEKGALRAFPSEGIFNYFLSRAMVADIVGGILPSFLRRVHLGFDVIDALSNYLLFQKEIDGGYFYSKLNELRQYPSQGKLSSNLDAIAVNLAPVLGENYHLNSVSCENVRWGGLLNECTLTDVQVATCDVRGCNLSRLLFTNCVMGTLIIDMNTIFPSNMTLTIGAIQDFDRTTESASVTIRSEDDKRKVIKNRSVRSSHANSSPSLDFFDRLMHFLSKRYIIRIDSDGDQGARMIRSEYWPQVKDILLRYNKLEIFNKHAQGSKSDFLRVISPLELTSDEFGPVAAKIRAEVAAIR